MKAAVRFVYGLPSVLKVSDVEDPTLKNREVLVRVRAATVNRTDDGILRAKPFIMRFFTGLFAPTKKITGTDFSGDIIEIDDGVTEFSVGDRVFGFYDGGLCSHAELSSVSVDLPLLTIPEGISYLQAVASCEGAHYAYNFLKKVSVERGMRVMVNGGTGAIGSALIQFLIYYGASVVATCRKEHMDLVKSFGVERVIDYTNQDFTQSDEQFDYVFDAVGKSTFGACRRILKPHGVYISSELGPYIQNTFYSLIGHFSKGKRVIFPIPTDTLGSLEFIKERLQDGTFVPLIDRKYPLDEIKDAYRYMETEQKVGNVIIVINQE